MNTKIVAIKFEDADKRLYDPKYHPKFRLVVSGSESGLTEIKYYQKPLTGVDHPYIPVTGYMETAVSKGKLTDDIIQDCLRNKKHLSFKAPQDASIWRLYIQEDVLCPEEKIIVAGNF